MIHQGRPRASEEDLATCHLEPIHIPGAIQPGGALLAFAGPEHRITHASANLAEFLGHAADAALGRPLPEVLGAEGARAVLEVAADGARRPGAVFSLPPAPLGAKPAGLVLHLAGERTVIEIEPAEPALDQGGLLSRAQDLIATLRRASGIGELCDRAVREVKRLTGHDRVMVYRFDPEGHGEVIAEACEPEEEPFLHLRYPASDIPAQARRMYLLQRVRVIGDADYRPIPVLAAPGEDARAPLDMTHCARRSVSPVHLDYMRNMGTRASLTVSLIVGGALWGMLVCHHRTVRPMGAQMRAMADLVGQVMSLLVDARSEGDAQARRLARQGDLERIKRRMATSPTVAAALVECPEDLLRLVGADGALLRLGGQTHVLGAAPAPPDALRALAALRPLATDELLALDSAGERLPALAPLAATASGILMLPINHNPGDVLLWFRSEVARTVQWAGNPDKAAARDPETGRIQPRRSFAAWKTVVQGRSAPWAPADLAAAQELRRAVSDALLRQAEAQLAHMSQHDLVTGLPNRRYLEGRLAGAGAEASLILLGLDRFKTLNDSLGHTVGDELLAQVARRIEDSLPPGTCVARVGGDAFAALCDGERTGGADALAERLLQALRAPFLLGGRPYRASASLGIATGAGVGLLSSADAAMHAAKRAGGNGAVRFESHLHDAVVRRLEIEQDLFLALDRQELFLEFQPLVQVRDGGLLGIEALMRWRHPRHGLIPPGEFIPLAEETALILPMGAWALTEALGRLAAWRRLAPQLYVSVNVSGQQLARPEFTATVLDALQAADLPAEALLLETTESVLMQDAAVARLEELRAAGLRIAIDDFGTGYSSLAYLGRLPVDVLKIDRSFLAPVGEDRRRTAFFDAVVRLAETLGLAAVAEGVERQDQWQHLRALGCHGAQGFWLSRPLPAAEVEVRLAQQRMAGSPGGWRAPQRPPPEPAP